MCSLWSADRDHQPPYRFLRPRPVRRVAPPAPVKIGLRPWPDPRRRTGREKVAGKAPRAVFDLVAFLLAYLSVAKSIQSQGQGRPAPGFAALDFGASVFAERIRKSFGRRFSYEPDNTESQAPWWPF